jgi:hypothetical protein
MEIGVNLGLFCVALIGEKTASKKVLHILNKITDYKRTDIAPPPS